MASSQTEILKSVIEAAQNINIYDYNKMMNDYELSTRQNKIRDKNKKKWVTYNRSYKKKIRRMKNEIEENYREKNDALIKKLNDKNQILVTSLSAKHETQSEEKRKLIETLIQKEKDAKTNVEFFLQEQEENRIKEGERTKEKMALFEERHYLKRKEFIDNYSSKLAHKDMKYKENWEKHQKRLEEIEKEREKKAFQKYEAYYWHTKDLERSNKEYKKKNRSKLQAKTDKLEELEMMQDERRKDILKKISKMGKNRQLCIDNNNKACETRKNQNEQKMEKIHNNLKLLEEDRKIMRQEILEYENILLSRSVEKDNVGNLRKSTQKDQSIAEFNTFETELRDFRKQMNTVKNESIFKKSSNERYELFQEKKRKEIEAKKKADEDKKLGS